MTGMREIDTPIGRGTLLGITPERDMALVMYRRPKEEQSREKGPTFIKWWNWDDEKGEIINGRGDPIADSGRKDTQHPKQIDLPLNGKS